MSEELRGALQGAELYTGTRSSAVTLKPAAAAAAALTDTGNAERFARDHGTDVRYVPAWESWVVWDGKRWAADNKSGIMQCAKATAKGMMNAAVDAEDRDAVKGHAKRALSRSGLDAMVTLAQSEPGIAVAPELFDAEPWLLNVNNGTLNLKTGKLQPHRREDYITKLAPVDFKPNAHCIEWQGFVSRVLNGKSDLITYLQRACGYALTGDVSEQCLFFLHGMGSNGKSTFINVLQEMLGDYARTAAPNLLVAKGYDAHPAEVAVLAGSRLVVCQETERGGRWAETTVKQLTGGDVIAARRMHENWWQFKPTHKFFIASNHKPSVVGTDEGIWRRFNMIPFEVVIPPAERDLRLMEKLRSELPGILWWCWKGCEAWQRTSLSKDRPAEVTAATDRYRQEQDVFGDFLSECCVLEPSAKISRAEVYRLYTSWCEDNGVHPLGARQFCERLREKGCQDVRLGSNSAKGWSGVRKRVGQELSAGQQVTSGQQSQVIFPSVLS